MPITLDVQLVRMLLGSRYTDGPSLGHTFWKYTNGMVDVLHNVRTGAVTIWDRRDPTNTVVYNNIRIALQNIHAQEHE